MIRIADPRLDDTALAPLLERLSCVEETCRPGDRFVHRPLSLFAILSTQIGEAEARTGTTTYHHLPGTLFAVAAGTELEERVIRTWRLRYLLLDGPWCRTLGERLRAQGGACMHTQAPRAWSLALAECVDEGLTQRPGWDWRMTRSLAVLLGGLAAKPSADGDLVTHIGAMVDAAPERPWNVAALARELGLAPRTLQARFAAATGEGPVRWIMRRRLSHARLLLERGMAVHAVATRLGFANPFHFSRVCRRLLGAAPTHLRTTSGKSYL